MFWSLYGRSWRIFSPLDRLLGSLGFLFGPPGARLAASCLPFPPLRPRTKLAQICVGPTFRTSNSTQLHSTQHHSTQLISTHFLTLRGAHFGASWPGKSTQDRCKSPLDTSFFQKRECSRNKFKTNAKTTLLTRGRVQDRRKIGPKSPPDTLFFQKR